MKLNKTKTNLLIVYFILFYAGLCLFNLMTAPFAEWLVQTKSDWCIISMGLREFNNTVMPYLALLPLAIGFSLVSTVWTVKHNPSAGRVKRGFQLALVIWLAILVASPFVCIPEVVDQFINNPQHTYWSTPFKMMFLSVIITHMALVLSVPFNLMSISWGIFLINRFDRWWHK
jgi:hypothetical protein